MGERTVFFPCFQHQFTFILGCPFTAKPDLHHGQKIGLINSRYRGNFSAGNSPNSSKVQVGLPVILHQSQEKPQRDSTGAMSSGCINAECGDGFLGILAGYKLRCLIVVGQRLDQWARQSAYRRPPRFGQSRRIRHVTILFGIGNGLDPSTSLPVWKSSRSTVALHPSLDSQKNNAHFHGHFATEQDCWGCRELPGLNVSTQSRRTQPQFGQAAALGAIKTLVFGASPLYFSTLPTAVCPQLP